MGDLRDQLMKAGLVTPEQAKKAEDDRKPPPRPPRPARDGAGPRPARDDAAPRPARDDAAPRPPAEPGRPAKDIAQAGRIDGRFRGGRRWYYVSRRGSVPYLELNDDAVQRLEAGAAAIAESPSGETWLVDADSARQLVADERGGRDWVRLFNRSQAR